jgi:hypothetical protein
MMVTATPTAVAVPSSTDVAAATSRQQTRPSSLAYGLTGAGALALSGFVVLGSWGYSEKRDLERTCSPFCQSSEVDKVRTKYVVADACLAVGVLSLGVATYLFLRDPSAGTKTSQGGLSAALSPMPSGKGGTVDITGTF